MQYMLLFSVAVIYKINKISVFFFKEQKVSFKCSHSEGKICRSNFFKCVESRNTRLLYGNLVLKHLKKKKVQSSFKFKIVRAIKTLLLFSPPITVSCEPFL